jgi:hypothetical protein
LKEEKEMAYVMDNVKGYLGAQILFSASFFYFKVNHR